MSLDGADLAIKRIKGLLELAANPAATAEEAASAAKIADSLIAKYRISNHQLVNKEAELEVYAEAEQAVYVSSRVTAWKSDLITILAPHYGCACFLRFSSKRDENGRKRKTTHFMLFGQKKDIAIVHYMFSWLSATIDRLTKLNGYGKGHVYCHSYSLGAVNGIKMQLDKSKQEIAAEAAKDSVQSAALVKIDSRAQEAKIALNKAIKLGKNTSGGSQARFDPLAFASGREAGSNIHLGKSLT